ncbi:MAG: MscL family protein [Candidatus Thorarchaeota archaeon]|nr:MscL family protein [Candidatus Thorarchaeota archaeon]
MENDEAILEELKAIRTLREPPPTPAPPKGFVNEFVDFLSRYKVLGLAVAFILGIYLGLLVQVLVDDLIMPVINLFIPDVPWEEITVYTFRIGHFVGELIPFIIVALVVFLLVKIASRMGIE